MKILSHVPMLYLISRASSFVIGFCVSCVNIIHFTVCLKNVCLTGQNPFVFNLRWEGKRARLGGLSSLGVDCSALLSTLISIMVSSCL